MRHQNGCASILNALRDPDSEFSPPFWMRIHFGYSSGTILNPPLATSSKNSILALIKAGFLRRRRIQNESAPKMVARR
jgi:hypothetical protein